MPSWPRSRSAGGQSRSAADPPLWNWHRVVVRSQFDRFTAVRTAFGCAQDVAPGTGFDAGGNQYGIVASVGYRDAKVFVRRVLTHRKCDAWSKRLRSEEQSAPQ